VNLDVVQMGSAISGTGTTEIFGSVTLTGTYSSSDGKWLGSVKGAKLGSANFDVRVNGEAASGTSSSALDLHHERHAQRLEDYSPHGKKVARACRSPALLGGRPPPGEPARAAVLDDARPAVRLSQRTSSSVETLAG
jgi:hypothetical protein